MKNKRLIRLILIIIVVLILICGAIIYNKKSKNNITTKNVKTIVTNTETQKNNSANETTRTVVKNTNVSVNSVNTTEKPKMLTQKEIAEKEKEANENLKFEKEHAKKYVSLEDLQDYLANKSTLLLLNEFPNEKNNETILNNKIKDFLKTSMTPALLKNKFSLNGSNYDLNQFDIEIRQTDDLRFAFNINTNQFIPNSNKDICITRTFSAE